MARAQTVNRKHNRQSWLRPSHALFERLKITSFEEQPTDQTKNRRDSFDAYRSRITFDGQPLDDAIKCGESKDLGNGVTLIRRI